MFSSYLIVISTAWVLKTITGCYVAIKFMTLGNKYYRDDLFLVTGVVMLVSYVTNSPLALLKRLISTPSVSRDEARAAETYLKIVNL